MSLSGMCFRLTVSHVGSASKEILVRICESCVEYSEQFMAAFTGEILGFKTEKMCWSLLCHTILI